jgi:hypothetical protein
VIVAVAIAGLEKGATMSNVLYFDRTGAQKDEIWALNLFGAQVISTCAKSPAYRLVELHEGQPASQDDRTIRARVLDAAGQPLAGIVVVLVPRAVSGAPVKIATDSTGYAYFPMDKTHRFAVPGQGNWTVGVDKASGDSDWFDSAGWVMGSKVWLEPVFKLLSDQPVPDQPVPDQPVPDQPVPDQPSPDNWTALFARLDTIINLLTQPPQ